MPVNKTPVFIGDEDVIRAFDVRQIPMSNRFSQTGGKGAIFRHLFREVEDAAKAEVTTGTMRR